MKHSRIKLKRCPFCGSKAALAISDNGIGDYYVVCRIGDWGDGVDYNGCGVKTDDHMTETPEHAAKKWNRRYKK